jgi:hypothetical protein
MHFLLQLSSLADTIKFRLSRDVMAQAPHVGAVMGPLFPMFHSAGGAERIASAQLLASDFCAVRAEMLSRRSSRPREETILN